MIRWTTNTNRFLYQMLAEMFSIVVFFEDNTALQFNNHTPLPHQNSSFGSCEKHDENL